MTNGDVIICMGLCFILTMFSLARVTGRLHDKLDEISKKLDKKEGGQ